MSRSGSRSHRRSNKEPPRDGTLAEAPSPAGSIALLLIGLLITGGAVRRCHHRNRPRPTPPPAARADVEEGKKLFAGELRHLPRPGRAGHRRPARRSYGVGAARRRLPGRHRPHAAWQMQGPQAPQKPVQFTEEQIHALAAYVAVARPRPGDPRRGGPRRRRATSPRAPSSSASTARCATTSPAAGGALTEGKYAPGPGEHLERQHIYEAMVTGPQNMPVFNDMNLTPEDKRDIITVPPVPPGERARPAASRSARSARSPRACSSGSSASARSSPSPCGSRAKSN